MMSNIAVFEMLNVAVGPRPIVQVTPMEWALGSQTD
jgi:hypothetical protein